MLLIVGDINPIASWSNLMISVLVLINPHVWSLCLFAGEAFDTESETYEYNSDRNDNCIPHGSYSSA